MPRASGKGRKADEKRVKGRKGEHEVPVSEPVIPPTSETDPWQVPDVPAPPPEGEPEIPLSLRADLLGTFRDDPPDEPPSEEPVPQEPPIQVAPDRRRLMWAGVLVSMGVIFGGWVWSLRYSLRIPPTHGSESAISDALETLRSQSATFGTGVSDLKESLKEVTNAPPSEEESAVIDALKDKVIQSAADGGETVANNQ